MQSIYFSVEMWFKQISRVHFFILCVAAFVFTVTAYNSIGHFHPDEHYQIIEFAQVINGESTPDALPWEYGEKMRPIFQPLLAAFVLKSAELLGVDDAYTLAFILRLLSGLTTLACITFFVISVKSSIKPKYWILFLLLSYFLWYVPFTSVRFSSELFSGLTLLVSTAMLMSDRLSRTQLLFIGLILGAGFLFRYQIAFSGLGIVAWLFLIRKESLSNVLVLLSGGLAMVLVGIGIDSWFYGSFEITLYNYFKVNLIDGVAGSVFGTSPWYYYILIIGGLIAPFGTLIIGASIYLMIKKKGLLVIWVTVPFLIGHSFIGHKEIRFLFPLIHFGPLILTIMFQQLNVFQFAEKYMRTAVIFTVLILLFNGFLLSYFSVIPASFNSRVKLTEIIENDTVPTQRKLLYYVDSNPYMPYKLNTPFYDNSSISTVNLEGHSLNCTFLSDFTYISLRIRDHDTFEQLKNCESLRLSEVAKSISDIAYNVAEKLGINLGEIIVLYKVDVTQS